MSYTVKCTKLFLYSNHWVEIPPTVFCLCARAWNSLLSFVIDTLWVFFSNSLEFRVVVFCSDGNLSVVNLNRILERIDVSRRRESPWYDSVECNSFSFHFLHLKSKIEVHSRISNIEWKVKCTFCKNVFDKQNVTYVTHFCICFCFGIWNCIVV